MKPEGESFSKSCACKYPLQRAGKGAFTIAAISIISYRKLFDKVCPYADYGTVEIPRSSSEVSIK